MLCGAAPIAFKACVFDCHSQLTNATIKSPAHHMYRMNLTGNVQELVGPERWPFYKPVGKYHLRSSTSITEYDLLFCESADFFSELAWIFLIFSSSVFFFEWVISVLLPLQSFFPHHFPQIFISDHRLGLTAYSLCDGFSSKTKQPLDLGFHFLSNLLH